MATTSSIGIGSTLDISSNITQLVDIERRPVTRMQHEATSLQPRLPAQYTAPDRQMASLTGLSNLINQQFGGLSNNNR